VLVSISNDDKNQGGLTWALCVTVGEGREGARGPRGGDRDDYRRKEAASGDFKPEFRGGFGKYKG
jgi:hypothetical protein